MRTDFACACIDVVNFPSGYRCPCGDPFLLITCRNYGLRRAFVTGDCGYVESFLCRKLVERGYTMTAFDLHYPEEDQTDRIQG